MPKCTPKRHRKLAAHRKAEAKWYKKHKKQHRAAVRSYYKKNRSKILSERKKDRTSAHAFSVAQKRRAYGGSRGRPREC